MKRIVCLTVLMLLLLPAFAAAQSDKAAEDAVWSREVTYWKVVQSNDLDTYRSLWRDDFLGWPYSSHDPARKAHITDWITRRTSKGERMKSYSLERLSVQVSGDMATTTYRERDTWVDRSGKEQPESDRILHTWHRDSDGTWRIFSGMSAPADGK
ncbi:MAG TPA: nuclear transport factor 2 family protein [Bryobacteraceae bacterium]|nr:nuclear transport factor 2 family protein [Bryobacteraceae bacterium]